MDLMADTLESLGWQVVRQAVAPERDNIYATRQPPVVVLSTHLDCVPPYLPLIENDEIIGGRGSVDAKGIAAAMVSAAEQLALIGEERVGLLFLVGEEDGSEGALAAASLEPKGRFLVNGEPTEGRLVIGQKGALQVDLTATGKAAHSGYPEEGSSAITALLDTLDRIRGLPFDTDPLLGHTTMNIGTIQGGVATNVIPPEASARLLFRTVGPTDALRDAITGSAVTGVTVTFPLEIPAYRIRGVVPEGWDTTVVSYGSDLPFLAAWGIGYQLGPGSIRVAHTDQEAITKAALRNGAAQYVKLVTALLALNDQGAAI